jgi:PAS domain S-box-containing protein
MVSSKGKKKSSGTSGKKSKIESSESDVSKTDSSKGVKKTLSLNTGKDIQAQQIFDQVEDYAIMILDDQGNVTSWNKGAEKIKGYAAAEIIGKNYRIFYCREDREKKLSELLLEEARTKGSCSYEGWRVRKDGTRFWGSMTLTALKSESGLPGNFLKITRDLTAKKTAEDQLSNLVEQLRFKNEELKTSEERYHKMVAEVKDYAIILLDADGTVIDWNIGAQKLKGYSSAEIIGKNFRLFYPREEKAAGLPERLLNEAREQGSVLHEGWRVKKDGTRFWGSIAITALHDQQGKIIGFSKVTRDLTLRKIAEDQSANMLEELQQANEKLKESEERYHKMIDEVQDYAIVLLSPKGDIQNWNSGAQFIKGYNPNEIVGKSFRLFYSEEDQERGLPEKLLDEARKNGKVVHEGWRVRKDGSRFWGNVVITALHDANRSIIGFSKVTRDLTAKKHAEEALKASTAELDLKNKTLERLNAELSSFSYIASHDLKEPLRKIQTFAGRIEDDNNLSQDNKEYLAKITQSAVRMQKLINDLLAYSEISNEAADFQRVDLNEVLKVVLADLEIAIQDKKAVIKVTRLPQVNGLYHQFTQLFFNLISNSIKFSKKDVAPRITIDAKVISGPQIPGYPVNGYNKYHQISIQDNGIGFDPEFSGKIFQAFQRLHAKHEFSGTGIGLAIVKKVIDNHNGIVEAQSTPGKGSTFNLYLPFENANTN